MEHFHSLSTAGVLRGLHYQAPPVAGAKLVICASGRVADAVLDLRLGSDSYGYHLLVELDGAKADGIYVPRGLAHGFCVLSQSALMMYASTSRYDASADTGVLWSSAGIPWPVKEPLVSARDAGLPPLSAIRSPFVEGLDGAEPL